MISVVIPTLNSERVLVPALSALVAGSAAGLIREVLLADGGSTDETGKIADAAGCEFLNGQGDEGERLRAAANAARGPWLMFLPPGGILDEGWVGEVDGFLTRAGGLNDGRAASFRLRRSGYGFGDRLFEKFAALYLALGRPRAEQGLLISKELYLAMGGHAPGAGAHARFLGRVGRRASALRSGITLPEAS